MAYRSIRETRREERHAIALIVFVVLAAALATGILEDQDDHACAPVPQRVVDVRGLD